MISAQAAAQKKQQAALTAAFAVLVLQEYIQSEHLCMLNFQHKNVILFRDNPCDKRSVPTKR